jgi:hypothetical protein
MRVVAALGLLAALAACQNSSGIGGGGGSTPAAQRAAPSAHTVSEGVLEVSAVDPQPIVDVEVIGPHGPLSSALSVHREDAAGQGGGSGGGPPHPMSTSGQLLGLLPLLSVGIGGFSFGGGGGSFGGVWLSPQGMYSPYSSAYAPGGGSAAIGAPAPSGLYRSTARVTLDDPAAYQRDWRQSHLRVRLGDPRTGPTQDLPAPDPTVRPAPQQH